MESDVITLQDLYEFKVDSVAADRTVVGGLRATGLRPTFLSKFERRGIELPSSLGVPETAMGTPPLGGLAGAGAR